MPPKSKKVNPKHALKVALRAPGALKGVKKATPKGKAKAKTATLAIVPYGKKGKALSGLLKKCLGPPKKSFEERKELFVTAAFLLLSCQYVTRDVLHACSVCQMIPVMQCKLRVSVPHEQIIHVVRQRRISVVRPAVSYFHMCQQYSSMCFTSQRCIIPRRGIAVYLRESPPPSPLSIATKRSPGPRGIQRIPIR